MKNNTKEKLEIAVVLISALVISIATGSLFFVNNTPQMRSDIVSNLARTIASMRKPSSPSPTPVPQTDTEKAVFSNLGQIAFAPLSKGVSAREEGGASEIRYEADKVTWIEYAFKTKDGKTLKLKIAEGQEPPPQSLIDLIH